MESSAQGAGAAGQQPQATREMPALGASEAGLPPGQEGAADAFAERPELFVGAAFAGGLVLAQVLKRLGR